MYTLFKDLISNDYYIISYYSIDYPDYMALVAKNYCEVVREGRKKELEQYLETELQTY